MVEINLKGKSIKLNRFFLILLFLSFITNMALEFIIIFGIVLFHEMAHSFWAGKHGMKTKEIELLPFGGVARIEGLPSAGPQADMAVALAGPLSNFVLAIIGRMVFTFYDNHYLQFFIQTNLLIGLFNLLPALPLDGGRILRGFLSTIVGFKRATIITANLGKLLAIMFFILSFYLLKDGLLYANIFVVALFLYIAAQRELESAHLLFMSQWVGKGVELKRKGMMEERKIVATPETEIGRITDMFLPQKYNTVRVLDNNYRTKKHLTETEVFEGLLKLGPTGKINDIKD
jgi:stage IV sporulation protein FB